MAYSFYGPASVNWDKAGEVGLSLLISPLFGFGLAAGCVWLLRRFAKNPRLFQDPTKGHPVDQLDETSTKHKPKPPFWIRLVLIGTCTGVSFAHGSNDGQKGVGLMMLVLIGIVPGYFALNMPLNPTDSSNKNTSEGIVLIAGQLGQTLDRLKPQTEESERALKTVRLTLDSLQHKAEVFGMVRQNPRQVSDSLTARIRAAFGKPVELKEMPFLIRKDIFVVNSQLTRQIKAKTLVASKLEQKQLTDTLKNLRGFTDYAPGWVLFAIALSLGVGTTVGWKRIVVTIGEKIGKSHLTYAQGASAELVAASTIAASTGLGLPVSTTHVLSSGIAGTMAAEGGLGNLQPKTIRSIALAWVLTLPVCIGLSAGLFILFRSLL
jgi:PiT family inorganic phosphate transporter